ncbi:MAG: YaaA family protein [Candidatus Azobacteroides sp.]|nr:YaaA family protein [Candidatus Azobacteroides sp.]
MLIILSPSKTIDFKQPAPQTVAIGNPVFPLFIKDADSLIEQLQVYTVEEIMEKEKMSLRLARSTYEYFQSFFFSNTPQKPAVFAFNGNVYNKLKAGEMNDGELAFLQEHVRIFSALYGILSPMDLIKPYRLDMNSGLLEKLYGFWRDKVTAEVIKYLSEKDGLLINLASKEYSKMINAKQLPASARVITPVFQQEKNGKYTTNSLHAKHARGLMTRFIMENEIEDIEYLKAFDSEGYFFDPYLSGKNDWYFVRRNNG